MQPNGQPPKISPDNRGRWREIPKLGLELFSSKSYLSVKEGSPSSPSLALHGLVSSVPLGSHLPRVSPSSTSLPSTADNIYDLSTPSSSHPQSTQPSSDFLQSSQNTIGPIAESPEAVFTAKLGSSNERRVKRLVKVVQGFSKAKELSNGLDRSFWSRWPRIFGPEPEVGCEAESTPKTFEARLADRLCRLKQIRQQIRKSDWEASRLWLLCLAHEVEHISQWKGIDAYTSTGVSRVSAAIEIIEKHLGVVTENDDIKKSRNVSQIFEVGGPAALLLDDAGRPYTTWERVMTLDDITLVFKYKEDRLPAFYKQTRLHDPDASCAIWDCFLAYGCSSWELQHSETSVMTLLRSYLQSKGPHTGDGPEDFVSTEKRRHVNRRRRVNKKRRVDQQGASTSRPDHDFPATSSDQFSPGSIDQATSSGIDNTVESMPIWNSSHLISFDTTRNLTDPIGNLDYAFNSSDGLIDPAIASIFVNYQDEFTDPAAGSILDYTINNSCNITDLDIANSLQSTHDQSMDALSNYETNPSVNEHLLWTVYGSDALIDPSTERVFQGATSPNQIYLLNTSQTQANLGWMRPGEQSNGSWS
ncbi:hypothetical protein G7Y89_g549 [Cudoniella acicularis]|uniref:Uncharacterized protein n=1 Tax=Cudoniella acicularis TaxID=354080 RepID=A0A8H4RYJ9_9HELO|nr:hypothetical protein G7Y89_g549 [Cudoniella acicularis]